MVDSRRWPIGGVLLVAWLPWVPVGAKAGAELPESLPANLRVDDAGTPFAETSFGGRLGCPFALAHRVPVIAGRVELANEIRLVHRVYSESLKYREFLDRGEPVSFDVPSQPGPVLSGLRLDGRLLALRTDFGGHATNLPWILGDGSQAEVPPRPGLQTLVLEPPPRRNGFLKPSEKRDP